MNLEFYKNRKVLVTGHTGFKGSWMCRMLLDWGAEVIGYALAPKEEDVLFGLSGVESEMKSYIADIRDFAALYDVFQKERPEIVIHMAAQPLVKLSYENPVYTYETNVMGTVNLLECVRKTDSVKSVINVTTDKVYKNNEWEWGYRENEPLDGFDPYSNSKSCSELVTHSYINSFFKESDISVSTARAGNVIGGGDFAKDRIIPDSVRAALAGTDLIVRNKNSVRPYQHVLEPVYAYLMIAQRQYEDKAFADFYNVGPDEKDCITTGTLAQLFCDNWEGIHWESKQVDGPHEANFLKLDCSRIKSKLGWKPRWGVGEAVKKTIEWTQAYKNDEDMKLCMQKQIEEFLNLN